MEKVFLDNTCIQIDIEDLVSISKAGANRYEWFKDYLYKLIEHSFPKGEERVSLHSFVIFDPKGRMFSIRVDGRCVILTETEELIVVSCFEIETETLVNIISLLNKLKNLA